MTVGDSTVMKHLVMVGLTRRTAISHPALVFLGPLAVLGLVLVV